MKATQSEIRTSGLRRGVALLAAFAALTGVLWPLATAAPAAADVSFDQKMLELLNQRRVAAGVSPVQPSLLLNTVAGPGPYLGCGTAIGGRADDMGARNYFSHTILNCGTQSVFNVLSSTVGLVYSAAGENIAYMNGTTDPLLAAERLMNDLMDSPPHRANILDARYTHVGIGSWSSAAGRSWTGAGAPLLNVWITAQVFAQMPLTAAPAVGVSPSSLEFGDRAVGTTGPAQAATVKNTGSAALSISGVSIAGSHAADFSIVSNACTTNVAPGASCSVRIGFAPGAAGRRTAGLSIAHNAVGGPHSVGLGGTGTAPTPSGAPANLTAIGGDGQLTITWSAPPSGAAPVGYGIWIYDAAGFTGRSIWACGTCTTSVVAGLANGKQHYAAVYSHNGTAWGGGSASNAAWVLAIPGAPTSVRAVPGDGSLTVSWSAPTNPGTGIDGYGIWVYDANGFTGRTAWVCATCTSAAISGLSNGRSYVAAVYAHNANGWGAMGASAWVIVGAR